MASITISDLQPSESSISNLSDTELSIQGGLVHVIAFAFAVGYAAGYFSH